MNYNSTDSSISSLTKKKKRFDPYRISSKKHKSSNPNGMIFKVPRLVKHDVRRYYAVMHAGIYNSYDTCLMKTFINEFYATDCKLNIRFPGLPNPIKLINSEQIMLSWISFLNLVPDMVHKLTDMNLIMRSDWEGECQIVCKFEQSYTFMYEVSLNDMIIGSAYEDNENRKLYEENCFDKDIGEVVEDITESKSLMSIFSKYLDNPSLIFEAPKWAKMLENPDRKDLGGEMRIFIDANRKISRWDYDFIVFGT